MFYNYTLWRYDGLVNHTVSDMITAVIGFPCAIIVFLTHWPKEGIKQAVYLLAWSAACTLFEYVSLKTGYFSYDNGWNIFWSAGVFFCGFIITRIHYKKPAAAWLVSGAMLLLIAFFFKLPLEQLK